MRYQSIAYHQPMRQAGATETGWVIHEYDPDKPCRITLEVDRDQVAGWRELIEKENSNGEG